MPRRWRAYQSLEWFIFIGLAMAAFFALVATLMLIIGGRQARVFLSYPALGGQTVSPYKYPGSPQQDTLSREPCDVDWDGDCDVWDYSMASRSLGKCLGDVFYERFADVDRDDCVTQEDLQKAFPERFPTPSTLQESSGWQTYRNEEWGFVFRYPPSWEIFDFGEYVTVANPERYDGLDKLERMTIFPTGNYDDFPTSREYHTVIAGRTARVLEHLSTGASVTPYVDQKFILFEDPDFHIFLIHDVTTDVSEATDTLDAVLSSFLFFGPAASTYWQTYQNEQYRFTLNYPERWDYHIDESTDQTLVSFYEGKWPGEGEVLLTISRGVSSSERVNTMRQFFEKNYRVVESDVTIRSVAGKLLTIESEGFAKSFFFERDGHVYNLVFGKTRELLFRPMIASFKFVE